MQTSQSKSNQPKTHNNLQFKAIEIRREFNFPVARLFEAFKTSQALKAWWWPKAFHADRVDIDFREGGKYFINMKGFERGGGGMTGQFEEIMENKRIVMTDHFADEDGQAISAKEAKMPGTWPDLIQITFEFESVDGSRSRFQLSQTGIPDEMQKECIQGWSESFDKLEAYTAAHKFVEMFVQ